MFGLITFGSPFFLSVLLPLEVRAVWVFSCSLAFMCLFTMRDQHLLKTNQMQKVSQETLNTALFGHIGVRALKCASGTQSADQIELADPLW